MNRHETRHRFRTAERVNVMHRRTEARATRPVRGRFRVEMHLFLRSSDDTPHQVSPARAAAGAVAWRFRWSEVNDDLTAVRCLTCVVTRDARGVRCSCGSARCDHVRGLRAVRLIP